MKASETKLLDFLHSSRQFAIPIYQRTYSWTEKECQQLWDDIILAGSDDNILVHFVGSIVYIDKADANLTSWEPLLVIDGQQRLTSVSLLLSALARSVAETEPFDGFSRRKIENYYLLNPEESGERHFKLLLSQTDKASLTAIVDKQELPNEHSIRIYQNFKLFEELIASRKDDLLTICKGLNKLLMVDIKLKRGEDNPQLIFESMNSLGKELSQADLIRNFILMGLKSELQTRLYELFWRPMEVDFGQEAYGAHFDPFMRHYLTVKTGEIPRLDDVYEAFKRYAHSLDTESLVADIRIYAGYYCAMALDFETNSDLKMAFQDLRELKVDVVYPFLLELYDDYKKSVLSANDFLMIIRLIENYVFRRAVCGIPTNSMNKTFANFSRNLKKDRYLESVQANFLVLPSYRSFPDDEEFRREIKQKDLYNFRSRSYWLRRLENYDRKERISVEEFTIEHIMPQNQNLSTEWRKELGSDWSRIQKTFLHTLGNLTLTGYNSEYSDKPFKEKRNMKGGFVESPLKLNKDIANKDHWTEQDILSRAEVLSKQALSVWFAPKVEDSVLEEYKPKSEITEYSIEDHPYLQEEPTKSLFEEIRKQILTLDPCVTETFLKLYVAYKAETNFVDIVPRVKSLRLTLNLEFFEINDPKGICDDVTEKGRWGNGAVSVVVEDTEEIPYVMGLIRQAFEKQMGSEID